jgi:hypothetical protein
VKALEKEGRLSELMLAMDVVDTLRHQEELVTTELERADREATLMERLRQIYKGQGIEISDEILQEGVRALRERRFAYTVPAPGIATKLALMWIRRDEVVRRVAVGLAVLFLVWLLLT